MIDNQIKEDVEAIIVHSQDFPFDVDAAPLMSQWKKAKAPFIKMFGGKTFIRSKEPIKVTLSTEQRSRKFNEFISTLDDNGILNEDFETFLRVNTDGFFENKVVLPYPTYHIPQGAKMLKSFKKFLPNQEVTRWAQDTASRYIQENKIEGYLYLSVDPRDFLTLSENDSNWWSCQSLDGDYRSGDLSYMVDETTMVAYLAGKEPKHFKCLPKDKCWFDKKWRMLIHTNRTKCIYYNRQYPYDSIDLLRETHQMITNLLPITFAEPQDYGFKAVIGPFGKRILNYNQLNAGGRTYDLRDLVDASDYTGYCDLIHSSSYSPIVSINSDLQGDYITKYICNNKQEEDEFIKNLFGIKIGGKVICPVCGEEYLSRDDKLLCDNCIAEKDADVDYFLTCHSCYRRIYDSEPIFFDDDNIPYCECCHKAMEEEFISEEEEI